MMNHGTQREEERADRKRRFEKAGPFPDGTRRSERGVYKKP